MTQAGLAQERVHVHDADGSGNILRDHDLVFSSRDCRQPIERHGDDIERFLLIEAISQLIIHRATEIACRGEQVDRFRFPFHIRRHMSQQSGGEG